MPRWTRERALLAAQKRHHPDADHSDLERDLRAARLEAHVRRVVDAFPPLTQEQRDRLTLLLAQPSGGDLDDAA